MSTTFKPHPNNVSTALASNYTAGSGSLVLTPGTGASFGSTFPMQVTVATAATVGTTAEVNTIFNVTGRTTDTLTGVTATEGTTDRNYAIGDRAECRWTSGLATAIETAVNGVENSTGITGGVISTARLGTGTPGANNYLRGDGAWASIFFLVSKSANTTILNTESLVILDTSSAAVTLTLPAASSATGREFVFIIVNGANTCTISRAGTDLILGGAGNTTYTLTALLKFLRLMSIGNNWIIVGSN